MTKAAGSPRCPQCGGTEFTVANPRTGEARCEYCRGAIVHEAFREQTETERFLALQRERPVIAQGQANDEAIAEALGRGLMAAVGFHPLHALRRFFRRLGRIALVLALVAMAALLGALFHEQLADLFG